MNMRWNVKIILTLKIYLCVSDKIKNNLYKLSKKIGFSFLFIFLSYIPLKQKL